MKAIIKYPGSKWSIADWIIHFFPNHRSYLEPFFGSGAVFFRKKRSCIETINDLDNDVINFFQWVRDDPEKLAHKIYWTPYSRVEYEKAFATIDSETDSLKRAVNFSIRLMMGYGYRTTNEKVGWKSDVQGRESAYAARHWSVTPEQIMEAAERLRGVQIEHMPAIKLIQRFNDPKVLIYADPPYLLSTRKRAQYQCEMTDSDHEELIDTLKKHRGPVILSGYESELYSSLLSDWYHEKNKSFAQSGKRRTEVLWMNFQLEGEQQRLPIF